MKFLEGKKALVLGIASNRSIAWGISDSLRKNGAELAFTYQNDKLKDRVDKLARECDSDIIMPCDVSEEGSIKNMLNQLSKKWTEFDIIVHSLAFAPREELEGNYVDKTTKEGFLSKVFSLMNKNPNYKMLGALGMMLVNFSVCVTIANWLKHSSLVS